MFIDTHCHLNFKAFKKDLNDVIERAQKAGVEKIIIPGAKLDSSQRAVEIAQENTICFAAVGIHPHHVEEYVHKGSREIDKELRMLSKINKVVAIGEIGLDYYQYKDYPPASSEIKKKQQELLEIQLDVAIRNNLPVIIHCREAQNDIIETIKQVKSKNLRGIFHCFDGDKEYLDKVLALGFFVGFDGNSTYPENAHLRHLVQKTPLNRLLLETDAPYLTPVPHRHTRNEPAYLPLMASCVSEIKQKSIEEIALQTTQNANFLFGI